jgi:hypothetical protein
MLPIMEVPVETVVSAPVIVEKKQEEAEVVTDILKEEPEVPVKKTSKPKLKTETVETAEV